jgi:hypothetical protein
VNGLDLSGEMLKSVSNGNLTYTLEYAKSKELEVLRYRIGESNYFIVRKGDYTLVCSDKDKSVSPHIDLSSHFMPANLGFLVPETETSLFLRNESIGQPVPGSGCGDADSNCRNVYYMDSSVGYSSKTAFFESSSLYRLSGIGYSDVERTWEIKNKDVHYVEKQNGNEVAVIDWKYSKSGVKDYKWNEFADFIAKDTKIIMVETKPGSSVGILVSELSDLKYNADRQDKIADRESGAKPIIKQEPPSLWGIGAGICLLAFIIIAAIAILRKRSV